MMFTYPNIAAAKSALEQTINRDIKEFRFRLTKEVPDVERAMDCAQRAAAWSQILHALNNVSGTNQVLDIESVCGGYRVLIGEEIKINEKDNNRY